MVATTNLEEKPARGERRLLVVGIRPIRKIGFFVVGKIGIYGFPGGSYPHHKKPTFPGRITLGRGTPENVRLIYFGAGGA